MTGDAGTPTAARIFAAFLVARAVFGLTYLGASLGRVPVPWYDPLAHAWELAVTPSGHGMGWFGLTAAALFAAGAAGGVTFLASGRGPLAHALRRASFVVAIAHAGALVLAVDFAYFGWTLTHQTPAPWSEPSCPR